MSRLSHSKHVLFYVAIIGSVLILFQVVSTYGEANLTAPPNLNGRYLSASAPPGCPEGEQWVLTIQQSGIYLNGSVELKSADAAQSAQSAETPSEEKPSLTGLWQPPRLNLSGETDALSACTAGGLPSKTASAIALQGQVDSATLTGQLTYRNAQSSDLQTWQFTAQHQSPAKVKAAH